MTHDRWTVAAVEIARYVLQHVVAVGDPIILAQMYLILVQRFMSILAMRFPAPK